MWKAYFVIIVIISSASYLWVGFPRFYEIIDIVVFAFAAVGMFGYAWEKGFIGQAYWKIFFFVLIIWTIVYHYFIPVPAKIAETLQGQSQASAATIGLIIFIPLFIAIFLYGYKRDDLW
jgi:hypothetical protein